MRKERFRLDGAKIVLNSKNNQTAELTSLEQVADA